MVAPLLEPEPLGAVAPARNLGARLIRVKPAAHQANMPGPLGVLMGFVVAGAAKSNNV